MRFIRAVLSFDRRAGPLRFQLQPKEIEGIHSKARVPIVIPGPAWSYTRIKHLLKPGLSSVSDVERIRGWSG